MAPVYAGFDILVDLLDDLVGTSLMKACFMTTLPSAADVITSSV